MTRLIEVDEIIAKGEELLAAAGNKSAFALPGALRQWYDETLAERTQKRNTIRTPGGTIEVGKTYVVTYRPHGDGKPKTLRGWKLEGRAHWSDNYLVFATQTEYPARSTRREVGPGWITEVSPA